MNDGLPVLVETRRGPLVEARHRGAIIAVDADGQTVALLGDDNLITSTRSTIKPIQALTFILTGAADYFSSDPQELALACASHSGEPVHTQLAARMLARLGLDESWLQCGVHAPYSEEAARELERNNLPFNQLHNNCSGKHAAMILTAAYCGFSIENYCSTTNPVQQYIISTLAQLSGLSETLPTAVDGCGAPTFGVPLRSIALAFARLAQAAGAREPSSPVGHVTDPAWARAAGRVVSAMQSHPEIIGGTKGRLDTDLLRAANGKLICKVGAEAVYSIGVLPSEQFPRALGIAIKIEDGSYRGLGPAVVETLSQLNLLGESEQAALAAYHRPRLENRSGTVVGEVAPVFELRLEK